MQYYVVLPSGMTCGHVHVAMNKGLARCWSAIPGRRVIAVSDIGEHRPLTAVQIAPLRAFLSLRGRGRPAGQTPLVAQASPLYARLSVDARARFEAAARSSGYDDLGKWAVALMEAAADDHVPAPGPAVHPTRPVPREVAAAFQLGSDDGK